MRIVLVRHGQTASNVRGSMGALDTAAPGAPLTAVGARQAADVARRWPQVVGRGPDVLAVSPLLRARQTARPLSGRYGVDVLVRPGIREIGAGDLEMAQDRRSVLVYLHCVWRWAAGDLDPRIPGGESGHEVLERALPVLDEVAGAAGGANGVGVLVTHGALGRVIAGTLADNVSGRLVACHPLGNAHTCVMQGDGPAAPGAWHALTWDDRPIEAWEHAPAGGPEP